MRSPTESSIPFPVTTEQARNLYVGWRGSFPWQVNRWRGGGGGGGGSQADLRASHAREKDSVYTQYTVESRTCVDITDSAYSIRRSRGTRRRAGGLVRTPPAYGVQGDVRSACALCQLHEYVRLVAQC